MYAYIKGLLVDIEKDHAIIDVSGQGFFIHTPLHFYINSPKLGSLVLLHTSFIVTADNMRLFGFLEKQDKAFFEKLITISGLGPKTALSIISHSDSIDLPKVIQENDITSLTKLPGIGKKTAQRIIIELADKLEGLSQDNLSSPLISDAIKALISLGYKEKEASKSVNDAIKSSKDQLNLSELISFALSRK